MTPSENWHRENLSESEFIGFKRRQPEHLRCESEKVMRPQRTSDNSEPVRSIDLINPFI